MSKASREREALRRAEAEALREAASLAAPVPRNPTWIDRRIRRHPPLSRAEWTRLRDWQAEMRSRYQEAFRGILPCLDWSTAIPIQDPLTLEAADLAAVQGSPT